MPLQHEPVMAAPRPPPETAAPPPVNIDPFAPHDATDDTDDEPSTQALVHEDSRLGTQAGTPIEAFAGSSADQAAAAASFSASYHDEQDDDDDAALLTEHSGHHTTYDESLPLYTGPVPLAPSFFARPIATRAGSGR